MSNGFLGYDTTFMLDFVVTALVIVVPILAVSLWQVKVRKNFVVHRNLQVLLTVILLLAVGAFEVDVQLVHGGWEQIVNKDAAAPRLTGDELQTVRQVLWVHLCFAISTPLLWILTITLAWKNFEDPPVPGPHSRLHKTLGWISTVDLVATSVTGLWFYYVAFVATA